MTFALAVIMLETTASVDLFMPIIFTLFVAYGIGYVSTPKSVYSSAMRSKNIPLLNKNIPDSNADMNGYSLMHSPVISFQFIVKVQEVYRYLENTEHSGFPVVNSSGRPVGIIERDALIAMIEHKVWYRRKSGESPKFGERGHYKQMIEDRQEGTVRTEGSRKRSTKAEFQRPLKHTGSINEGLKDNSALI